MSDQDMKAGRGEVRPHASSDAGAQLPSDTPLLDKMEADLLPSGKQAEPAGRDSRFNFTAMTLSAAEFSQYGFNKLARQVVVRRPANTEFFSIKDDDSWFRIAPILSYGSGKNEELYFVHSDMCEALGAVLKYKLAVPCITRSGVPHIWLITPLENDNSNTWTTSAHDIIANNRNRWIRVVSNHENSCYDCTIAQGDIPDPVWPFETAEELLSAAFNRKTIEDQNHLVVRKLYGLA